MTQELLLVQEVTKLLKQVQRKHIHIVDGADKIRFKLLYLSADIVFLVCRILVNKKL